MNRKTWDLFCAAREKFRSFCGQLLRETPGLLQAQQKLADGRAGPDYTVETPVLFNFRLDGILEDSEIKLILVADNPGRREQAAENRRYLAGPSGKIAARFFRENPEINIDFDRNILILNKTPVHTPRTGELRELCRLGGEPAETAVKKSQRFMAELLCEFQSVLSAPVWITGYSEMKPKGIFGIYTESLQKIYGAPDTPPEMRENIFLFRHFSMNQFTIDLKRRRNRDEPLSAALARIGAAHRCRVLGW